jgi:DNA-binding transcriptional LysR family regulator
VDLAQVRAFVAVAETLHFGRAADHLHVAQPHLSRTIRALEGDLGAPLFRRTTRRVELTAAGQALVEPARELLAAGETARSAVTAAHEGRSGRVRIGFAGPSAHVAVGQLARAVREEHPLIDLEFLPGRYGATAVDEVIGHEADLALARFPGPPAGVASRSVTRDRCVVAVPTSHHLAGAEAVHIADLRDEPVVALPESSGSAVRGMLVARCHAAGFAPRFVQSAPDSWTCVALVSASVGLHFTTVSAVAHLPLDGVRIREIDDPLPPIAVYLVWREDDHHPALHRVLETAERVLRPS